VGKWLKSVDHHRKKELSSSGGGYPAINRMNSMYDFGSDPFFLEIYSVKVAYLNLQASWGIRG